MIKKRDILIFIGFLIMAGNVMSAEVTMLNQDCARAFHVASVHLFNSFPESNYSVLIEESGDQVRIVFYHVGDLSYSRGGGGEQVVYIVSKRDFSIASIKKGFGK